MVTTFEPDRRAEPQLPNQPPRVDVVVPVFNEAHVLDANITNLHHYLRDHFPFPWRITIADNASTDATWQVARSLRARYPRVAAVHLDEKGRGRALRAAWTASDAEVVAYMDVDLSTDLDALLPLVAPLLSGHSDLAIGSRLSPDSRVVRGPKRELISRTYNRILRLALHARFHDAQCGFKAIRADVARALLPAVEDNAWFFDTELLVLAERNGLRIAEVPVDWIDDPDSRVDVLHTAIDDLRGVLRLVRSFWFHPSAAPLGAAARAEPPAGTGGELVSFVSVGVVCTLLYLVAFVLLQGAVGPFWANAVGLTVTMVINTAAHRRFTFGRRGPGARRREYTRATAVHVAGLALTTGALAVLQVCTVDPSVAVEAIVLTLTSTIASALRFVLMPAWVFRHRPRASGDPSPRTAAPTPPDGDLR
jgi:putative flippase GtrA